MLEIIALNYINMSMYIVTISVLKFHKVIKADTFRDGTDFLLTFLE